MKEYYENFEKWCRDCVCITDKLTGATVPFVLNAPQRRVLGELEKMRREGRPIRMIMLKARQWGGSTLIQTYMAWMQLVRHTGWNSLICAHVKDASANIRGMYSRLLREYPERLKEGNQKEWQFVPYEKSTNINRIPSRDCLVAIATALSPNGVRGGNFSMAHLSEVAFWGEGDWDVAEQIVRTVCGSITLSEDSLIVMESTANGEDNYFHSEWLRAVEGKSDKVPVFVAWHEIEIYSRPVADEERRTLLDSLDDYERSLMQNQGVSLEHIAWYHDKRREYTTHRQMMSEYPSTPEEAFASTGTKLFSPEEIELITCPKPSPQADTLPSGCKSFCTPRRNTIITLFPGDKDAPHTLCVCSLIGERVAAVAEWEAKVSLNSALGVVAELSRIYSAPIAIISTGAESHAKWFVSRALRRNVALHYGEDSSPVVMLNLQSAVEIIDAHREMMTCGKIIEYNPQVMKLYETMTQQTEMHTEYAPIWCRMLASYILWHSLSAPSLSPNDFF